MVVGAGDVPIFTLLRYIVYLVTATLSTDAVHDRLTWFVVTDVWDKLVGTVGGVISGGAPGPGA